MKYITYNPCKELNSIVKCYWTLEDEENSTPERQVIMPDGCMEMIFHYGDLYKQYGVNNSCIIQPKCFVFGQISKHLDIEPIGKTNIFAVRFHPEGFTPFANIPIKEMENKATPLDVLFKDDSNVLELEMFREGNTLKKIDIIEKFLINKMKSTESIDRTVKSCIEVILKLKGKVSIKNMAEEMNVNARQLERKFLSRIGLSPKQLSKIVRLQAALKMMEKNDFENLTIVAHELNYYDQAHFIKDFKAFTGYSPKKFFSKSFEMNNFFLQN